MAITKVKNYNIAPYYDDYDESKNYHRVLFRPGFAVQARELTQLQTSLYSQIDKLGQYSFEDGSRVVGGKVTVNTEYDFIKLTSTSAVSAFVGNTIEGGTNGVTATVLAAVAATGGDPDTLYIKYDTSGTANATKLFVNGETITDTNSKTADLASSASTGKGSKVDIDEGVYFISGTLAYVAKQTLILDKYTNTPSYIIGLSVTESLVDNSTDVSLVDNAQGTPNYAAPGAHRYKIATALIKESLTAPNTTYANYIMLMKIKSGIIQVKTDTKTANTELTTRLARRTHEESGNYSVAPFSLDIREHLDDEAGNGGYLIEDQGGVATKLAIGVEPSIAYVQGFRVENLATKYVAIDIPRDHVNENEKSVVLPIGNYVKLTVSTIRGMPDINAYSRIELRNSSSTQIGYARVRGLEIASPTIWNLYLFDITMNSSQTFSNVAKVFQTQSNEDFAGDLNVAGVRYDSGNNGLVFKLPYDGVKSLLDSSPADPLEYNVRVEVEGTVSGTGTSATISFSNLPGTLQSNSDILVSTGNNAAEQAAEACVAGVGTTTLTLTNAGSNLTGWASGTPHVKAICTVQKNASGGKKNKTLETIAAANFTYASGTGYIPLDKSDIHSITSVTIGGADASEKFRLDNGQRDNFYDEGRLYPIGNWLANGVVVNIAFKHFSHAQTGDYFTVDSYPTYTDIPTFDSSQGKLELRDCIDFRPTKASAGSFTEDNVFTNGTGFANADAPKPGGVAQADISHYLGRIDKLYIDREGDFAAVTGVAATNPQSPDDIDDSMTIFELHHQPYVFNTGDCIPVKIDSKRYTMRDIGAIDSRVKNLEYYTSLSLLEKEASQIQIQDGSANDRLKNGIVVDGFYGHNIGNITHPDYNCSIDKGNGVLRPRFHEDNIRMVQGTTSNVTKTGSLLHLPFTETVYIEQPYATMSEFVNPYNVFTWGGEMKLSPESDEWKDTDTRPDVVIDDEGVYDQLVNMAEESGILGTVWNEWETNWTGVEITESTSSNMIEQEDGGRFWSRWRRRRGASTTTTVATTTTSNQARSGLRTTVVPDTQLKEMGSRVVETNFVPFMRSREIFFKAERMKPDTKVYAFFNGANVTDFCAETSYVEWSGQAVGTAVASFKNATAHASNSDLITDASGKVEGSFRIPHNSTLKFKTGTREFRLSDSSINSKTDETTFAEALYHAQGLLEVKENVIISTKVPRFVSTELTDSRVIQDTAITRFTTPVEWVDPLAQTFIVDTAGGIFASSCEIYIAAEDASIPINLSIRAVENGTPTQQVVPGSSVNIYPSAITTSATGATATKFTFDHPIYLGQDQEYAIVLISQSDDYKVFIAEVGGFDLQNTANRVTKQPYNGVFFTSQNASTWTPEQTKDLKFKLNRCNFSQTSGTVVLNNDRMPTKTLPANPLRYVANSGSDCIIRVTHPNHGMYSGSSVDLAGFVAENGIAAGKINATHVIGNVEHDSYSILISSDNATTVAIDGGGSVMTAAGNINYNIFVPQIQTLEVPGTGLSYSLAGRTGKSQDGTESAYAASTIGAVLPNSSNVLTALHTVCSQRNEIAQSITQNTSLALTATFAGTSTLSPIIDMNRCSATLISNKVNDAGNNSSGSGYNNTGYGRTYVAETVATGGSEINKYITKRIDLKNEASNIDVYISANKPKNANIDLYYKTLPAGSDSDFDSEAWVLDPPESVIPDNDGGIYNEVHYVIAPGANFGSFAIKLVLRTSDSSYVPSVKDFRAIAAL